MRLRDWLPFTVNYHSMLAGGFVPRLSVYRNLAGFNSGRVLGVGWRRWVLFLHCPGAYGRPGYHLSWCNYYGEGEG